MRFRLGWRPGRQGKEFTPATLCEMGWGPEGGLASGTEIPERLGEQLTADSSQRGEGVLSAGLSGFGRYADNGFQESHSAGDSGELRANSSEGSASEFLGRSMSP